MSQSSEIRDLKREARERAAEFAGRPAWHYERLLRTLKDNETQLARAIWPDSPIAGRSRLRYLRYGVRRSHLTLVPLAEHFGFDPVRFYFPRWGT